MANNKNVSLNMNEKLGLLSNLATMLSAGIPIMEAVNSLLEDAKGNTKKILETLRDDLSQGEHMYVSFSKFPRSFNAVTINLIKAAEEAGTLTQILKDIKKSYIKEMEFTDKIKSALVYPVMIMVVFFGVLLMMLVVVVPKISSVFLRMNVELPLPTKILIGLSQALLHNTLPFVGSIAAVITIITVLFKRNRNLILTPLFALPLISKLVRNIDLTRFSHNLYLLLNSGLPIVTALELSQEVILRKDTRALISQAREMVMEGKKLSEGFRPAKGHIPSIMIKLIEVGDKTGTLDKSMEEVSEFLDTEVTSTLKTVTVLIEPIMLVLVGVLVGGMMLAIISPIYGLIGQVSH